MRLQCVGADSSLSITISKSYLQDMLGEALNQYQRFAEGDEAALKDLYQEFGSLIYGLSKQLVGSDAEDLTQNVFISAWRSRASFDEGRGTMKAWLCSICRNRAIDILRKRQKDVALMQRSKDQLATQVIDVDSPVDSLVVHEALADLPVQRKQVLEMCYIQGMTHQQISDKSGFPLGTVKSHINRGLRQLASELGASRE